jgi:hypothetical protein
MRDRSPALIRASVERSPDGNLWLTLQDADTGAILRLASGPYTDRRQFLDGCRLLLITRAEAEELYDVAKRTGRATSGPLTMLDDTR